MSTTSGANARGNSGPENALPNASPGTPDLARRGESSGRSPLRSLTGVQILATGGHVPECVVRNEDLAAQGYDADWIVQRTGIRERRRASGDQATSDLAVEAARQCLESAQVDPSEVDLILVATMTPDTPTPSTACHLQRELGSSAPAMDISAACAGFMYAMVTGMQYVKTGASQKALVVGSDVMTRIVDPADKKTFPLFGDGAGAVLLGAGSNEQGLLAYTLGADGRGADCLYMPAGGSRMPIDHDVLNEGKQFLHMDGRTVFKWAVRLVYDSINDVLGHAGITTDDVDLVVFHQANVRILDAAIDDLNLPRDRVIMNLDRYGNTSAGSIPLALDEAHRQGRIAPGNTILFCGFGAGLAWGTAVARW